MNRAHRPSPAITRPTITLALVSLLGVIALSVSATACSEDSTDVAPTTTTGAGGPASTTVAPTTTLGPYVSPLGDIVGEALYAGSFGILAGLLVDAGLVQALRADGPFTVFAPTDDAFATVPAATLDAVMNDNDLLTAVLTYHVVAGAFSMADAKDGDVLTTLQGQTLTITKDGDKTFVNGIEIAAADVPATNGTINVLAAGILVPES